MRQNTQQICHLSINWIENMKISHLKIIQQLIMIIKLI